MTTTHAETPAWPIIAYASYATLTVFVTRAQVLLVADQWYADEDWDAAIAYATPLVTTTDIVPGSSGFDPTLYKHIFSFPR